jgi:hypothetical protein
VVCPPLYAAVPWRERRGVWEDEEVIDGVYTGLVYEVESDGDICETGVVESAMSSRITRSCGVVFTGIHIIGGIITLPRERRAQRGLQLARRGARGENTGAELTIDARGWWGLRDN